MYKQDEGHRLTDEQLTALEKRISRVYGQAAKEVQAEVDAYFRAFARRDAEQKRRLDAGEITEQQYKQWRLAQMGRGKRFEALRDKLAERMTRANEVAAAYVNDATPGIYSLNRNYAAYTIEQVSGDVGFTLWDEQTVGRLLTEQPDLMPYYPPARAVKRGIDLAWGKKQITAQVTSGILMGESIGKLADRLQRHIPEMNRTSAIRAARTAVTGAECAGRQDTYLAAEKMGLKFKKRWLATLDGRTRHAHALLDGQTVAPGKPFKVDGYELMFPGDKSAPAYLVYNCRCTVVADLDGIDTSDAARRAVDPVTGEKETVTGMTYQEWIAEKRKKYGDQEVDTALKKIHNENADKDQWTRYRERIREETPKTFKEFQRIKYGEPAQYADMVGFYRYKGRVPEATKNDFEVFRAVKATGIYGSVRVPPKKINTSGLAIDAEHIAKRKHNVSYEDATAYIDDAIFSLGRTLQNGKEYVNYYSSAGAAYIDTKEWIIRTAFQRGEYDRKTKRAMEAAENARRSG